MLIARKVKERLGWNIHAVDKLTKTERLKILPMNPPTSWNQRVTKYVEVFPLSLVMLAVTRLQTSVTSNCSFGNAQGWWREKFTISNISNP